MTRPPDHPRLVAPISGVAAAWLHGMAAARLPEVLPRFAQAGLDAVALAELQAAVVALGLAAGEWRDWRTSVVGSAELGRPATGPRSAHGEINTHTAAALLAVSPRRVRQLCAAGLLDARRVGHCWLVDRGSVDLYGAVRRPA